jgi:hypothetical protein
MTLSGVAGGTLWAGEPTPKPASQPTTQPTTTTLSDGTPVTTNPDGSKTSQYEPGSSYTQHPDGSKTVGETTKGPDGKPVKTDTTYKPDGTRIKSYPDDPTKKPEEEKPTTTLTGKKGQKTYVYSDGTSVKFTGNSFFDFVLKKRRGNEITEFKFDSDGGRSTDVDYDWSSPPPRTETHVSLLLDNRPERLFSVAGNYAPMELTKTLQRNLQLSYDSAKPATQLASLSAGWKLRPEVQYLGTMNGGDGNCNLFTAKTWEKISEPEFTKSIEAAIGDLGYRSCDNFPHGELNFCTIFTPLTAFRGHDHAHHHGSLHSHDAPDPPLNWGRKPPEIIIRLNLGAGGR